MFKKYYHVLKIHEESNKSRQKCYRASVIPHPFLISINLINNRQTTEREGSMYQDINSHRNSYWFCII